MVTVEKKILKVFDPSTVKVEKKIIKGYFPIIFFNYWYIIRPMYSESETLKSPSFPLKEINFFFFFSDLMFPILDI